MCIDSQIQNGKYVKVLQMYEMDKIIDYFVHNVDSGTMSKGSIGLKEPIDFSGILWIPSI